MPNFIGEIKRHADCRALIRRFWPDHFREKDNCLCFVHGDSNESLQVSREFVYCHGCGFKADAIDLYERGTDLPKGDAIRELSRELGLNNGAPPAKRDLQGRWAQLKSTPLPAEAISYLEQKRALVGIVESLKKAGLIGFAPKTQRYEASIAFALTDWQRKDLLGVQYVPIDGTNKKFLKGTPAKGAFFRMDGRGDDFLVITEGIVNALSVLVACKTIGVGVGAILGSEFTDKLKNLPGATNPVFFFDNDDAGRKATAKAIQVVGGRCQVVDWSLAPAGMNDANDLLRAGHAGVIERMVRSSRVTEAAPALQGVEEETGKLPALEDLILDAESFCRIEIPPRKQYLNPWLQEHSIIGINGWRGVGKTWFGMGAIDAVTKGESFGPWKCEEPTECLYIDGEMFAGDTQDRLRVLGTGVRKKRLMVYSDAYITQQHRLQHASLSNDKWRNGVKDFAVKNGIKLIVFDNLSSLCPGLDENSKQEFDPINQYFLSLRFSGITVVYMHHVGKSGTQRGTSGREDNIDISIELKHPPGYLQTDGCRFTVSFTKARIATANLPLIADTEMQLVQTMGDVFGWTFKNSTQCTKLEVLRLFDAGASQKDIAGSLGITSGRVSQLKAEFIKAGYLTSKGKITQVGHSYLWAENA